MFNSVSKNVIALLVILAFTSQVFGVSVMTCSMTTPTLHSLSSDDQTRPSVHLASHQVMDANMESKTFPWQVEDSDECCQSECACSESTCSSVSMLNENIPSLFNIRFIAKKITFKAGEPSSISSKYYRPPAYA